MRCVWFELAAAKKILIEGGPIAAVILPLNFAAGMEFDVSIAIGHINRAQAIGDGMSGGNMGNVCVTGAGVTVIADDGLTGGDVVSGFDRPAVRGAAGAGGS